MRRENMKLQILLLAVLVSVVLALSARVYTVQNRVTVVETRYEEHENSLAILMCDHLKRLIEERWADRKSVDNDILEFVVDQCELQPRKGGITL